MSAALRFRFALSCAVALAGGAASCNAEPKESDAAKCRAPGACAPMDAVIAMGDSSSSGVGAVSLSSAVTNFFGVDLGKDQQLATSRGRVFYIARDLDTVFELSPTCGEPTCRFSTRRSDHAGTTNPQDVAVAPDGALWIPRFGLPNVAVIEPDGKEAATLALPDLDGDGNPNASAIRIVDIGDSSRAFVALELLDDRATFRSRRPSALAVFDTKTRALEKTIELRGRNPFNTITEHAGRFFFACAGNFDAADEIDAGIERLDPRAPDTGRLFVNEKDLGGSPTAVAVSDGCAAAIVADATKVNATSVVTFDPESGETFRTPDKGGPIFGPSEDFHFWAIAWIDGKLLVGDRRRGARGYPIHVFDRSGKCDLTKRDEPIWVAQKPVALRAKP